MSLNYTKSAQCETNELGFFIILSTRTVFAKEKNQTHELHRNYLEKAFNLKKLHQVL